MKSTEQIKSLMIDETYLVRVELKHEIMTTYMKYKGINVEGLLGFIYKEDIDKHGEDSLKINYFEPLKVTAFGTYKEFNNQHVKTLVDITVVQYKEGAFNRYIKGNVVENITIDVNSGKKLFPCKNEDGFDMSIPLDDIGFIYYIPFAKIANINSH